MSGLLRNLFTGVGRLLVSCIHKDGWVGFSVVFISRDGWVGSPVDYIQEEGSESNNVLKSIRT